MQKYNDGIVSKSEPDANNADTPRWSHPAVIGTQGQMNRRDAIGAETSNREFLFCVHRASAVKNLTPQVPARLRALTSVSNN